MIDIMNEKENNDVKFGIVCLVDALGVSSFNLDQSIEFIKIRDELLNSINEYISPKLKLDNVERKDYIDVIPKIVTFGDSIILTWESTHYRFNSSLCMIASRWLSPFIALGITKGILFRGAISSGYFIEKENTILGPALADAAKWYEAANWFGIFTTPTLNYTLNSMRLLYDMKSDSMKETIFEGFVKYPVPLKLEVKELWSLAWPNQFLSFFENVSDHVFSEYIRDAINFLGNIPKGSENKYENAINFYMKCKNYYSPDFIDKNYVIFNYLQDIDTYKTLKMEQKINLDNIYKNL